MSCQRSATQPQKSEAEYPKTMLKRAIAESRVLARPNLIIQIDSLYGKKILYSLDSSCYSDQNKQSIVINRCQPWQY